MFETLTERLTGALSRLRGKGRLRPEDVSEALREVRLALLEADVDFRVVRDLVARIREEATGAEVLQSLSPAQTVVKIVHDRLQELLGTTVARLTLSPSPPTVLLLVGLQGSGKTTLAAKLALHLRREGHRPLLVAADRQRPAAQEQLQVLGARAEVPVFAADLPAVEVAAAGVQHAVSLGRDVVVVDTAGRLQIDEELMDELAQMKARVRPHEVLLVLDSMMGQEAVKVAQAFHQRVGVDGVVLTKLDGDARGGAALSVRAVTGLPIKFASTGERLEALEPFYPDRMASRILGMGDVLSLIERAQAQVRPEDAAALERKMRRGELDLEDLLQQMRQLRRAGPLRELLAMIPGFGQLRQLKDLSVDDRQVARMEAIILSMTPKERRHPEIIDGSRRRRIARGSGTTVQDVNRLLRQFEQMRRLVKQAGASRRGPRAPWLPPGWQ